MEGDLGSPVFLIGIGLIGMAVSVETIKEGRETAKRMPGSAPWSRSRALGPLLLFGVGTIIAGLVAVSLHGEHSVPSITFTGIAAVILGSDLVLLWYLSGLEKVLPGKDEREDR